MRRAARRTTRPQLQLFALEGRDVPAATPVGPEFLVNVGATAGDQFTPAVASDVNGNTVVVWEGPDANGRGVFAQRYNAAGAAQGARILVNAGDTANDQFEPAVAMDDTGDFVVTWTDSSYYDADDSWGIVAQRFNAAGTPQGGRIAVASETINIQRRSTVAMDAAGNFVVAWTDLFLEGAGGYGVYARRFNAAGTAQGGQFQVSTTTAGGQDDASVGMDANGNFVITWQSPDGGPSTFEDFGVYARRFNAAGTAQGAEVRVNTYTTERQFLPSVGVAANGTFVVAWESEGQDGESFGIYFRRYAANGTALGGETQANAFTNQAQRNASVAVDADGDFVIAWQSATFESYGSNYGIAARQFTAAGAPQQAQEFLVNTNTLTTRAQSFPSVAVDADGDFIVAWQSDANQDGNGTGIYGRLFDEPATVSNAPTLGGIVAATYPAGSPPVVLAPNGTATDPDSPNLAGGTLTVSFTANGGANDRLAVRNQGTGAGQVGVSGTNVTFGGVVIGTFAGGTSGTAPLVITFNAASTPAIAQAVLRNVTFQNTNAAPTVLNRTIRYVLTDGDGGTSTPVNQNLTIQTAANVAPTLGGIVAATYPAGSPPVVLAPNGTATDPDSPNLAGGTLTVSFTTNGGANDRLAVRNQGTGAGQVGVSGTNVTFGGVVIGTFAGGTSGTAPLVITFNAASTPAIAQAVLRNVTFQNTNAAPTVLNRTIRYVLTDGDGGTSTPVNQNLTIQGANGQPTDIALSNATVAENAGANAVVGSLSASDPNAGETFTFTLVGGAGSGDNGRFNIVGNQLRATASLNFENRSSYSIRVRVTDSTGMFFEEVLTVTVTNVNEPPVGVTLFGTSIDENAGANELVGYLAAVDPEGNAVTFSLVAGQQNNNLFTIVGNQLRAAQSFDFETDPTTYTVLVRATDTGGLFRDQLFTITVNDVVGA